MPKHSEKAISTYFKDNKYVKKKGHARSEPVFNLKVPESEKYANDNQWFKDYAEWIVPAYSSIIDNYKEMKLAYDIYNDNLDGFKAELDKFCNKMGENVGQIEEEIQPYPKLHNMVNVLKGELIKRNDNFKIVLLSIKAIKDKNEQLINAIKASVEEEVMLEIEKIQMQMQNMKPEEIKAYIEDMRTQKSPEDLMTKNFQSEWEIFYSKALKYAYFDQDVKMKQVETLEDSMIADRFFIYSGWKHGKPYLEVRNTLYSGFQKAPNEMMVHKGDYFWYKQPITIADAYNNYGHLLSQDDLESLGIHTYSNNYRVDKRHALGPHEETYVRDQFNEEVFKDATNASLYGYENKQTGTHQGQGINRRYTRETLIWETHIEFKAFRELIFLSYTDDYGSRVVVPLSSDFEMPDNAEEIEFVNEWGHKTKKKTWIDPLSGTEYSAESLWIPRKYEVIRLGNDIYPICREVPFQSTNTENPFSDFTLSTFGAILTSRNAKSISPLQRAIPAYFQYLYVKHIQNRELSKYQGYIQSVDIDQIPSKLGKDIDGNLIRDPIATWMLYRKQLGIDFFSGTETTTGALPPSTRSPGSHGYIIGTAGEIFNLQQLLNMIDVEIGMAMGISPQRLSQFSQDSNVSDNQQAITQSHHITEPYFFYLKQVWKDALNDYIKNFRTHCANILEKTGESPMFHYVLPDGTEELFAVTPRMLEPQSIGIFLSNSMNDERYNEIMLQLSHSFGQNAGEGMEAVSSLVKAITSGTSPEETHKLIQIEVNKQQKRMQEMEQTKLKVQEEYAAKEKERMEDIQKHEIDKIIIKEEENRKTQLEKAAIEVYKFAQDKDEDKDGVPDYMEGLKLMQKLEESNKKLSLQERQLDLKEKEMGQKKELEEKKLKIQAKKPQK